MFTINQQSSCTRNHNHIMPNNGIFSNQLRMLTFRNSINYYGIKFFNIIPEEIKLLSAFKTLIINFLKVIQYIILENGTTKPFYYNSLKDFINKGRNNIIKLDYIIIYFLTNQTRVFFTTSMIYNST